MFIRLLTLIKILHSFYAEILHFYSSLKSSINETFIKLKNGIIELKDYIIDYKKCIIEKREKLKTNITQQIDYWADKFLVEESGLFDREYYLKNYRSQLTYKDKIFPLDHYLKHGWRMGFNPSDKFDGTSYYKTYGEYDNAIGINPLVHYLKIGIYFYNYGFQKNVYQPDVKTIEKYLQQKSKRKSRQVIYTCITGGYDNFEEISSYTYVDKNWDYICFTDDEKYLNQKQIGIWEIRPLVFDRLDNVRNNRYHKINAHLIFPEYEESIYIDSNINILTPFFFNEIKKRKKNILLPKHACNTCIYQEYQWAYKSHVDDRNLIRKEWALIKKSGMPRNYGQYECNLIYRKHNKPEIIKMMEQWWWFIENYAKRDQLAFSFIMWQNKIGIEDITITNTRILIKDFCVFMHLKDRL